jgi:hypothetical protein
MEGSAGRHEQTRTLEALKIKEQWNAQVKILSRLGILETFPGSKQLGIRGIDGKEYPVPKPEEILKLLEANREMILKKMEQGFTKLVIEPFAYSSDALSEKYKGTILRHHKDGKLFATKEKPTDPDEPLELDLNQPLWRWEEGYSHADTEDKAVYFPTEFGRNHGGKTKKELLASDPSNAWRIWLLEDMPNIPREGKGIEKGGRRQLETNRTPNEYLQLFQTNPVYGDESGLTPEADLMYAITHLEETNQVINDYQGKGSLSYQTGAYFPASGYVPYSCWNRGFRRAYLNRSNPSNRGSRYGVRAGVRVKYKV